MLFSWLRSRRRKNWLAQSFSPEAEEALRRNVRHMAALPPDLRERVERITKVFVREKNWEGLEGLTVTDEMRYTIAAQAAILAAGITPDYYFEGVKSILLFPRMIVRRNRNDSRDGVLVTQSDQHLLGEAMHRGPIALSWRDVLRGTRGGSGSNVVLHEFAHYLDGLDGAFDGQPPLAGRQENQRWKQVFSREFHRLVEASRHGQPTLLDQYGATNPAEFFAVATECFFELPVHLHAMHPELYDVLQAFFQQDPASWYGQFERAG